MEKPLLLGLELGQSDESSLWDEIAGFYTGV